jgi:lysozyme family protein
MRGNLDKSRTLLWAREAAKPEPKSKQGGATRYGLTRRTIAAWKSCRVSDVDLDALEAGTAGAILDIWFWRGVRADELPAGVDYAVFCAAVAEGPKKAITDLQFVLTTRPTGEIDARLIQAAFRADPVALIRSFCTLRHKNGADPADTEAIENEAVAMVEPDARAA